MRNPITTLATALVLISSSASQPGCNEQTAGHEPSGVHHSQCLFVPQARTAKLDLLFVVDDSTAMAGFEAHLATNRIEIIGSLQNMIGELPDLHIGVVTTVLGTAPHSVPGCPEQGHGGKMNAGTVNGPVGATYLIDVRPSGCDYTHSNGNCIDNSCDASNCGHAPGTWLVVDEHSGCPRCRNYDGELTAAFNDTANAGISDCAFSQPLEAMKQALESPANAGFRRENAYLGIFFITAGDDCSAGSPLLFAPEDPALGALTSFRCFEHGVSCTPNGRDPGTRQDCQPRDEPDSLLKPLNHYVELLQSLVDPRYLVVSGALGPYDPADSITVELDTFGQPRLAASCTRDATAVATPSVRLRYMLSAFNEEEDLNTWASTPICAPNLTAPFVGISPGPVSWQPPCFELRLRGCSDPTAAAGTPRDDQICNDDCLPNCVVTDIQQRGTPDEAIEALVPCLEVCDDGPCPDNVYAPDAYAKGRPEKRDYLLPVDACWYVSHDHCTDTGLVIVARRDDPPPRTFVDVCCELIPDVETLCDDGLDDDGDCLVDLDDPDCG